MRTSAPLSHNRAPHQKLCDLDWILKSFSLSSQDHELEWQLTVVRRFFLPSRTINLELSTTRVSNRYLCCMYQMSEVYL